MAIKYTNETGINLPMAVWLLNDNYDHVAEENYISVTTLLKPIREIILSMQNRQEEKSIEISTLIKSQLGSALHESIERAWMKPHIVKKACELIGISEQIAKSIVINPDPKEVTDDQIPVYMEQRVIKEIDGFKLGGKYDLVLNGEPHDYKSASTFTYVKQTNAKKYVLQGSMYRWLNPEIITSDILTINYLFTDWVAWKTDNPNYPPFAVMEQHFDLLSIKETEDFIKSKLAEIKKYKDTPEHGLPYCTDEELWKDPPVYKYYKKADAARATKNFDNRFDAEQMQRKNGGAGLVKEVQGTARACNYCSAFAFCSQALELQKAGLLG